VANEIDAWTASGGPFATLQSFDNAIISINLSASLLPKVSYIGLAVNDYLLIGQPRQCLTITDAARSSLPLQIDWPKDIRPADNMKWANIAPVILRFSGYTPLLIKTVSDFKDSTSAIPKCEWHDPTAPQFPSIQ